MTEIKTPDGTAISSLCFGCMQFGDKAGEAASREMYRACREAGINFFDTAHAYTDGTSENWLGRFAAEERDAVVIASKAAFKTGSGRTALRESLDTSRKRLDQDVIDIYYLHRWDDETPLEETFETLAEMQRDGAIRHIGVSNFAAWQVMKAQAVAARFDTRIDILQPMYNLVKRQAEVEILPMAMAEGIAVVPYSPLGGGLLTGKYRAGGQGRITENEMYSARYAQEWMHNAAADLAALGRQMRVDPATLAVAWAARHRGVTAPIISARDVEQLRPSLDAISFGMDDELYERITALTPTPPPATDRLEEAQ
ncbi:aldo/keto reductase [Palleronia sp. LCG004]|uniref:aldo/keto reductase n=1 Tax=Palleronia sp. LCG004 TaxID=3079304 RepID=UPI002941FD5D|nr:aldo/keto reductase [Palleronia sp. LCG004]WOI55520.1 aldo/keto reductase [Palleronia sp. LCG004]